MLIVAQEHSREESKALKRDKFKLSSSITNGRPYIGLKK